MPVIKDRVRYEPSDPALLSTAAPGDGPLPELANGSPSVSPEEYAATLLEMPAPPAPDLFF